MTCSLISSGAARPMWPSVSYGRLAGQAVPLTAAVRDRLRRAIRRPHLARSRPSGVLRRRMEERRLRAVAVTRRQGWHSGRGSAGQAASAGRSVAVAAARRPPPPSSVPQPRASASRASWVRAGKARGSSPIAGASPATVASGDALPPRRPPSAPSVAGYFTRRRGVAWKVDAAVVVGLAAAAATVLGVDTSEEGSVWDWLATTRGVGLSLLSASCTSGWSRPRAGRRSASRSARPARRPARHARRRRAPGPPAAARPRAAGHGDGRRLPLRGQHVSCRGRRPRSTPFIVASSSARARGSRGSRGTGCSTAALAPVTGGRP
jgi:hypothetical protein